MPRVMALVMALVLEGGSLAGPTARYGVRYPAIQTRPDRTITRLNEIFEQRQLAASALRTV